MAEFGEKMLESEAWSMTKNKTPTAFSTTPVCASAWGDVPTLLSMLSQTGTQHSVLKQLAHLDRQLLCMVVQTEERYISLRLHTALQVSLHQSREKLWQTAWIFWNNSTPIHPCEVTLHSWQDGTTQGLTTPQPYLPRKTQTACILWNNSTPSILVRWQDVTIQGLTTPQPYLPQKTNCMSILEQLHPYLSLWG